MSVLSACSDPVPGRRERENWEKRGGRRRIVKKKKVELREIELKLKLKFKRTAEGCKWKEKKDQR